MSDSFRRVVFEATPEWYPTKGLCDEDMFAETRRRLAEMASRPPPHFGTASSATLMDSPQSPTFHCDCRFHYAVSDGTIGEVLAELGSLARPTVQCFTEEHYRLDKALDQQRWLNRRTVSGAVVDEHVKVTTRMEDGVVSYVKEPPSRTDVYVVPEMTWTSTRLRWSSSMFMDVSTIHDHTHVVLTWQVEDNQLRDAEVRVVGKLVGRGAIAIGPTKISRAMAEEVEWTSGAFVSPAVLKLNEELGASDVQALRCSPEAMDAIRTEVGCAVAQNRIAAVSAPDPEANEALWDELLALEDYVPLVEARDHVRVSRLMKERMQQQLSDFAANVQAAVHVHPKPENLHGDFPVSWLHK